MTEKYTEDKRLLGALDYIDDKFIAEVTEGYKIFEESDGKISARRTLKISLRQFAALAACLALLACIMPVVSYVLPQLGTLFSGNAGNPVGDDSVHEGFADMSERDLIEHIGKVPDEFKKVVENNLFKQCFSSGDHVFVRYLNSDDIDYTVYDKYGNIVDEIDLESEADAYRVYKLSDGNYIKVRAYDLYYRSIVGSNTSEEVKVPASVEKFTPDGKTVFETEFDIRSDLEFFLETDDGFVLAGWQQNWLDADTKGFYIYKLDKSGNIVHQRRMDNNGEKVFKVEYEKGEVVLYCRYYKWNNENKTYSYVYKKYYLRDTLSTRATEDEVELLDDKIAWSDSNNYRSYWDIQDFLPDFDAGHVSSVIYYDDLILIISEHDTKWFEYVPMIYSSMPSYTETVYTAYTYDAEIIWRSAVDSTDYERLAEIKKEYDEERARINKYKSENK